MRATGYLICIVGWVLIWSQIPDGPFSRSGAIVFVGLCLNGIGDAMCTKKA